MALNGKQQAFANAYLKSGNITQAAIAAGYSEKTAHSQGSRLLKNVKVRTEIERRQAKIVAKVDISQEWVLKQYKEIAEDNKNQKPSITISALDSIRDTVGYKATDKKEIDINVKIVTGVPDPE